MLTPVTSLNTRVEERERGWNRPKRRVPKKGKGDDDKQPQEEHRGDNVDVTA